MTKSRTTPGRSTPADPSKAVLAAAEKAGTALQSVAEVVSGSGTVQVIRRLRRGRWTLTEVYV